MMHSSVTTGRDPLAIPFYPNDPSSSNSAASFLPSTSTSTPGGGGDPQSQQYPAGAAGANASAVASGSSYPPRASMPPRAHHSHHSHHPHPHHHHQHNSSTSSTSSQQHHPLSGGIDGYHHVAQQQQHPVGGAGPSTTTTATMAPPLVLPRGYETGNDAVVAAVERLGKDVGAQLSSLSVQLSSLVSLMSQLVDGRNAEGRAGDPKRRRFDSPIPHHHHTTTEPPHSSDGVAWNSTAAPYHRRHSTHPFAFDPAADEQQQRGYGGATGAESATDAMSSHHHYPQPPATADGSVMGDANGMTFYPAPLGGPGPMNGSAPPPQAPNGSDTGAPVVQPDFYNTSGVANGNVGFDVVESPNSRTRPGSSYGSVRPFTAVDHSQRPPAPAGVGGMAPPAASSMQQHRPMRVDFDMGGQSHPTDPAAGDAHRFSAYDSSAGFSAPHGGGGGGSALTHSHSMDGLPIQTHSVKASPPPTHASPFAAPGAPSSSSTSARKRGRASAPTRASTRRRSVPAVYEEEEESDDEIAGTSDEENGGGGDNNNDEDDGGAGPSNSHTGGGGLVHTPGVPTGAGPSGIRHKRAPSPSAPNATGIMGDWKMWAFDPPRPPEAKVRALDKPRWRTLQSARLDLQRKTGRTMAKLGRLPLKDYLEVSPPEYLAARKSGRAAYQEWLEPLKRLAKQDADKVKACTNFIEYTHPMLSQCEGSFKARQLLQQIIDNAIDEATNAKKKAESSFGAYHNQQQQQQGQGQRSASPAGGADTSGSSFLNGSGGGGEGNNSVLSVGARFASPRSLTRSAAAAAGSQAQAMSFGV